MKVSHRLSDEDRTPDSTEWQRARRPEHKAARRDAILAAAISLLDEQGVEGATLTEIARRAGLSKANCYRYYESREAILLSVTLDEARAWTTSIVDRLTSLAGSGDIDGVAQVFASTSAERPRLCMLISCLSSVLERNVSAEAIASFKRAFHRGLT
jgi:AcrR family transcriptional regulator